MSLQPNMSKDNIYEDRMTDEAQRSPDDYLSIELAEIVDRGLKIKRALNRKVISMAYHSNVPVFQKSNGPFSIYDYHSLR
jgi:hypothetical protein